MQAQMPGPQGGPQAAPQGGPQGAPQGGGPEEAMKVFGQIGDAMAQVGQALEGAPPEIKAKFDTALAAYQDFMDTFTGSAAGPSKMAPEQAGNPDIQPVR